MAHFACLTFLLCRAFKSVINYIILWQKKLHLCCSSPVKNTCRSSNGCKKKKKALFLASCVQQLQCPCRPASQLLLPHLVCLHITFPLGLALSFCAGHRLVLLYSPLFSKHLWAPDLLLYSACYAVYLLVSNKNPFAARGKNVVLFHV